MIILAGMALLNVIATKASSAFFNGGMPEYYYGMIEQGLQYYDLNNAEDKEYYISDKTTLEIHKLLKDSEYDIKSWQYEMLQNKSYDSVHCIVKAEIEKDDEAKKSCQEDLDDLIESIKTTDWRSFVKDDIENSKVEIENYKEQLLFAENDSQKININKMIKNEEYHIEALEYRLKNDIPVSNDENSNLVDQYESSRTELLNYNKDEKTYASRDALLEKRRLESVYYTTKYKLDNNIKEPDSMSAGNVFRSYVSEASFIVLIGVILIASQIVAEEYNKGTIKQLLLRPYTRVKILLSKYFTVLIVFLILMFVWYFMEILKAGFIGGFNTFGPNYITYSFASGNIESYNLISYALIYFIALLPMYLILITIAFTLSAVTGSTAISICLSLAYYIGASAFVSMFAGNTKYAVFLPSQNWDFTQYLFGGIASNQYITMTSSIIVTVITFVLAFVIGFIVFKRKDIKNQ